MVENQREIASRTSNIESQTMKDSNKNADDNSSYQKKSTCEPLSFIERAACESESVKMRRVDWRWAAAKGFFNKQTNQWNEEIGGKEAYIRQRNERIVARFIIPP